MGKGCVHHTCADIGRVLQSDHGRFSPLRLVNWSIPRTGRY